MSSDIASITLTLDGAEELYRNGPDDRWRPLTWPGPAGKLGAHACSAQVLDRAFRVRRANAVEQLEQAEGAKIAGDVINNVAPDIVLPPARIPPTDSNVPVVPDIPSPNINIRFNPFAEVFWIFFWAVIVAAFAMLLSLFWQPQIERTVHATAQTWSDKGFGAWLKTYMSVSKSYARVGKADGVDHPALELGGRPGGVAVLGGRRAPAGRAVRVRVRSR